MTRIPPEDCLPEDEHPEDEHPEDRRPGGPSESSVEDRHLALALRGDQSEAVTQLLQTHGGKVRGYLRRRFPTFGDWDLNDVLVDAVLVFRDTFDPERSSAGAWLLLLAHQQAVNRLRGQRQPFASLQLLEYEPAGEEPDPQAQLEWSERFEEIQAALSELSDLERAVVLADLDAGTAANARILARQLHTTERSIYAARTRARQKLVQRLTPPPRRSQSDSD